MVINVKELRGRDLELSNIKMDLKTLLKNPEIKWLNIFFRDIILVLVVCYVQYWSNFRSIFMWLLTGMLIVFITWHFSDYLKYKKLQQWHRH